MTQIDRAIVESNPWWKGKFALEYCERDALREIRKFMAATQIVALTGLRRVGKTTLMLKLANDAIKTGADSKNILYFSFDEHRHIHIRDVLDSYSRLLDRDIDRGAYMVMFDEIQKLENWEDQLKRFYDAHKKNVKIIISGSESLFIKKKSKESLAGRMFEFKIEPLTFKEFLTFTKSPFEPSGLYERELSRAFDDYGPTMGFPELAETREHEVIRKYVKESVIEKVIYRDLPALFPIRNSSLIESLMNIFTVEPGQIADHSELAKQLQVSRHTVAAYLEYLENSFLIRRLYNFSGSRRKVERKLRKYYPAVIDPDIFFNPDSLGRSRAFEWLIIRQLKGEFFWRDAYKNEVDLVLMGDKPMPVEIKYGKIECDSIIRFMQKFRVKEGYIVARSEERTVKVDDMTIHVEPAPKFLLRNLPDK